MSDNFTPLPVKTKTAGDVVVKVVDTAGTNQLAIDGSGNAAVKVAASTNIIGKVGIDQTTDGTTNAVHLTAGTNIAGKFGIDQTTPGTTNGVQVNAALPAGTNLLGKTGIDQTTPGTTNGVQITGPGTSGGNPLFVSVGSSGTVKNSGSLTSSALAAGGNATLSAASVTTGKQGTILHVVASSSVPLKIEIQTVNNSNVATTQVVGFILAGTYFCWNQIGTNELQGVASADGTNNKFQLKITNMDGSNAGDIYGYIAWSEV